MGVLKDENAFTGAGLKIVLFVFSGPQSLLNTMKPIKSISCRTPKPSPVEALEFEAAAEAREARRCRPAQGQGSS